MKQVPGRLEKVEFGQPYLILIDYAHTEDALRQLLHTVRGYTKNRMLLVFGCGGERDRGKRPVMGRVAAELADEIILTSDNPRNEDPDQIIRDVMAGIPDARKIRIIPDREEAIGKAIEVASTGDALVLAGKGHENYQIIGTEKLHFDEREILAKLLTGVQGR
jgi:UDP-N-acetylmuramoyl-L-alanyl-D-glutamate--2,6-diaminopimelate ligase